MRSHPDSSRKLEGREIGGAELPTMTQDLPNSSAGQMVAFQKGEKRSAEPAAGSDGKWLMTAQQIFRSSTDFFDGNLRTMIEESMDLYRSKHPKGSKYNLPSFQKRSRLFRPKIRSAMRKKEAQVAKAFFSTHDVVQVSPVNTSDSSHILAAKVQQTLLQYRLTQIGPTGMQWFQTVVGAFQDASKQGFVISRTDWEYKQATQFYSDKSHDKRVVRDRPVVTLIPVENFRVSPNCDWSDPINSSDYLIELIPMSIARIREWQEEDTLWHWRELSDAQLQSGTKQEWDSIRSAREGNKTDRYEERAGISEFDTVWLHKNIVRIKGEDYVWLTVGTEIMLTEPMPLSELDPRGYRPYTWGYTVLEAHNPYPDGDVQMAKPVQEEINELANMRADASKMATAGRYFYRRGSAIDTEALTRFVPGSAIEVTNVQNDVRWDKAPDANKGAFEEGELLNNELSDLLGTFQTSNVQGNRKLNETVGGMQLIADNANEVSEFTVRTFSETWVEPTLCQVLDLLCYWETDENIAKIVGDQTAQQEGMAEGLPAKEVFRLLNTPMQSSVSVGYGATNPESRIRRIQIGVAVTNQIDPMLMHGANKSAILGEVWGACGVPDVRRFFPNIGDGSPNSELKRVTEENMQLRQMVESGSGAGDQVKLQIAKMTQETQVRLAEMKQAGAERLAQLNNELKWMVEKMKGEMGMLDLRLKFAVEEREKQELYMQREALSHTIQMAEREFALAVQGQQMEQQNVEADRAAGKEERDMKKQEADAKGQKPAVPDATPPGVQQVINRLRKPGSGAIGEANPMPGSSQDAMDMVQGAPDMDNDEAGVIARDDYGSIPGAEG